MHFIDDKANGICINHNSDWSGDVRLVWYIASERRDSDAGRGATPLSLRECQCKGIDLIAGRFTRIDGPEPPVNVITRAVALAVETYLRSRMEHAVDELFIHRGAL